MDGFKRFYTVLSWVNMSGMIKVSKIAKYTEKKEENTMFRIISNCL